MKLFKWLSIPVIAISIGGVGFGQSAKPTAKPTPVSQAWYFVVTPPPGDGPAFNVGPWVGTNGHAMCNDTLGSALYSHPYECHITGPVGKNCINTGNGFAYPKGYPYPVPTAMQIVNGQGCVNLPRNKTTDLSMGLYFLFYGPNQSAVLKEGGGRWKAAMAKVKADPVHYAVGNYSDMRCPDAPFFAVGNDNACN